MQRYDMIIIGTGVAATTAAAKCRDADKQIAIIEHRAVGGTCALRGCDPKKAILAGIEAVDAAERMKNVLNGTVTVDWPALMEYTRSFTTSMSEKITEWLETDSGIDLYRGTAVFTGRDTVEIDGETEISAERILVATGARPATLPFDGAEHLITSEGFMELEHMPKRVVFVGGGYIATEFAGIAVRAGAEVTVLQMGNRLVRQLDGDIVALTQKAMTEAGVNLVFDTAVTCVEKHDGAFRVFADGADGTCEFDADLVVHSAGRTPNIDTLNPAAAGIVFGKRGITVNDFLQSTGNEQVYAAGDCADTGAPQLTPVSSYEGRVAAENMVSGNQSRAEHGVIPTTVFSLPPMASVGITGEKAVRGGDRYTIDFSETTSWFTNARENQPVAGYKIITDRDGTIAGAHLVGSEASEVINLFALAMRNKMTSAELRSMIFTYPTAASDISSMLG